MVVLLDDGRILPMVLRPLSAYDELDLLLYGGTHAYLVK